MKVNYHTHTARCNHACGTDADYAKAAYENGLSELGFSDHTPQTAFPDGFYSFFRMKPHETKEYAASIRALKEEYKGKMDIHLGFEVEYYPDCFDSLCEHLKTVDPDYLILGQHFTRNEYDGIYVGSSCCSVFNLNIYTAQIENALETGLFTYLAHPDLPDCPFDTEDIEKAYRRICRAANKADIPVEFNLLGLRQNRWYPTDRFFKIAAEENTKVILGLDAHTPEDFNVSEIEEKALKKLNHLGITPIEELKLIKPFK